MEQCFNNQLCVAKLVPITGGYSIDATEVTAAQYAAWLATKPLTSVLPSLCTSWKSAYNAGTGTGDFPVANVDWCDAYGYCAGVGKRLCGRIGGGAVPFSVQSQTNPSIDQWFTACSSDGKNDYPYGSAYQPQTCNGQDHSSTAVPVGSMSGCAVPVSGNVEVYDLSGNVWEWEDSCKTDFGQYDTCLHRGGSFADDFAGNLECGTGNGYPRCYTLSYIGFRCCSNP